MADIRDYKLAAQILKTSRKPLATVGALDPDSLGACLALLRTAQQFGAKPTLHSSVPVPENLTYLLDPSIKIIYTVENIDLNSYDAIFIPDQSYLSRTGFENELKKYLDTGGMVVNLDHHVDNNFFGTINVVDHSASAACIVAYDVIKESGAKLTTLVANSILIGILADTGNFTNSATNERALEVAAQCYSAGANGRTAVQHLYFTKSLSQLKLWGRAFDKMLFNSKLGLAVTVLTDRDFEETGAEVGHTDGLANFFNNMDGVRGVFILRDIGEGKLRGSFRTTRDDLDLGRLAKLMGGGGHRKACGFTINGKLIQEGKKYKII
jgi:phosphoesterase RecJ-like protein